MAETIGLIASLVSIAGAGLTLAQKLHDYGDGVASSGKRTQEIAFHVRSTATVVEEVASIFKEEGSARRNLISQKAVETVEDVVKQCSALFDQLHQVLDNTGNGGGLGKLLFPLRESRLVLLQSNLERLKTTLQCFMQVIIYARDDDQSQRRLIEELISLRKQAAATYERDKIKAQDEDEREPSGPFLPNCITIPSEPQLSAGEPTEDKEAPASIAANANHLDPSSVRRHQGSICSEQIEDTNDGARSQTEKRVRPESLATSSEDPTRATEPVQDHARTGLDGESPELARAWDDLVHAIDQLGHALAVTCCCCRAKRKSETAFLPPPSIVPPQYCDYYRTHESLESWTGSTPRSAASSSIHREALPNLEEATYAASDEVDELLDLWTNLNQESSGTTAEKIEE
ncbi:uncharacterized protein CDV56_109477 [Aspergillus thermomutatus]|uniref:Fungal N-terminal domain-containing protein n=1 Tax=Aspergillus thermomutatus TaxID=41047 RepID=A0A397HZH0_ASPTH|nr:uncharacterized protein CDV56_109477 [Aspergillus thermomutatus]RHZ66000.1 hypothetical protein CDV56_109477 [Aspergillus thermomutatus]